MTSLKKFIPNFLTFLRILNTPFIIVFFILGKYNTALIITILTAITDCFDGFLARKFNVVSEFGKKLDAFSDKVFAGGLLLCLAIKFKILIISIIIELVISYISVISYKKDNSIKTLFIGKIKTCFLFFTLILGYLSCFYNQAKLFLYIFTFFTLLLQIITTYRYFERYKQIKGTN